MTDICKQLKSLTEGVPYAVTNLSNACALLFQTLPLLNWSGFYFMKNGELALFMFQGKTACTKIQTGKGVCGTAVMKDEVLRIADVHKFPGHIACDSASKSEIVIPLHYDNNVIGVLDIDSPVLNRFSEEDERLLCEFSHTLENLISRDTEFLTLLNLI